MADQDLQFLVVFLNIILLPDNLPKLLSFTFHAYWLSVFEGQLSNSFERKEHQMMSTFHSS